MLRRSFTGVPDGRQRNKSGANETNVVILALVLLLPHTVHADRITRMNQFDNARSPLRRHRKVRKKKRSSERKTGPWKPRSRDERDDVRGKGIRARNDFVAAISQTSNPEYHLGAGSRHLALGLCYDRHVVTFVTVVVAIIYPLHTESIMLMTIGLCGSW